MEVWTNETSNNEQQGQNFENLEYDSQKISGNILFANSSDTDLPFFNTNISDRNTPYILPEEIQNFPGNDKDENTFVLHLNVRSITKNFKGFKMFLSSLSFRLKLSSKLLNCMLSACKSGDKVDANNYYPISVLPVFLKIMEKAVNLEVINFLENIYCYEAINLDTENKYQQNQPLTCY